MQDFTNALPALILIAGLIIVTLLLGRRARKEDKRRAEFNDYLHTKKQIEYYQGKMKVNNKGELI